MSFTFKGVTLSCVRRQIRLRRSRRPKVTKEFSLCLPCRGPGVSCIQVISIEALANLIRYFVLCTMYSKIIHIAGIQEELPDFKVFNLDSGADFHYKAGQYLTLIHPQKETEVRRSYSITSAPGLDDSLSFGVKRIPNGFYSRLLVDHAKLGDQLITSGVGGLFVLPDDINKYQQLYFFAAGSGITPIYALIKFALHFHPWLKLILIYSTPSPARTIFLDELQQLQEEFKTRFTIQWLFGNAPDLTGARLYRESLIHFVNYYSVSTSADALFYICGPLSYMRMCTFVLLEMNVPPDNIKRENFLIAQPKPFPILPPDKETYIASIRLGGSQYEIPVHYPDSILQAARKVGVILPYSCETGRCANCIARCIKGTVWLSNNEVLTESDLARGLTLTCVGHPQGGNVNLVYEQT